MTLTPGPAIPGLQHKPNSQLRETPSFQLGRPIRFDVAPPWRREPETFACGGDLGAVLRIDRRQRRRRVAAHSTNG